MENTNTIDLIIEYLNDDANMDELVEDVVYKHYEDYLDSPEDVYDENKKFIYENDIMFILEKKFDIKNISSENIQAVLNIITKYLLHKIEAKANARHKAKYDAELSDYKSYYGGSGSAYSHLLEKYLEDFQYYKNLNEVYEEHLKTLEQKGKSY